jgi:hypothetical protein
MLGIIPPHSLWTLQNPSRSPHPGDTAARNSGRSYWIPGAWKGEEEGHRKTPLEGITRRRVCLRSTVVVRTRHGLLTHGVSLLPTIQRA